MGSPLPPLASCFASGDQSTPPAPSVPFSTVLRLRSPWRDGDFWDLLVECPCPKPIAWTFIQGSYPTAPTTPCIKVQLSLLVGRWQTAAAASEPYFRAVALLDGQGRGLRLSGSQLALEEMLWIAPWHLDSQPSSSLGFPLSFPALPPTLHKQTKPCFQQPWRLEKPCSISVVDTFPIHSLLY